MRFDRAFWINTFFAWLLFLGIDFLFHAAILKIFWTRDVPAIKPLDELALLIPFGYLSFYLLTLLIGFTFINVFPKKPTATKAWLFAVIWGGLYSMSNFLGLYSYVEIPLKQLSLFNLVYFIEITAVCLVLNKLYFSEKPIRWKRILVLSFFGLILLGIVLQNILS